MRARNRPASRKRRNKILKMARGHYGARSRRFRAAKESVYHAMVNMFRSRKQRKRDMRALWIIRINAAARSNGMKYGELINALKKANITLNRKVLADLAVTDASAFTQIVSAAKAV